MDFFENKDFNTAFQIIERTSMHLFLTGKAGTGKTTFLRNLITRTNKQVVVTAPTGIAAINAGGVTLHSLFQLDFGPFVPGRKSKPLKLSNIKRRLIKYMDLLVIDEVSMVRADLLDAVDHVLRIVRNPLLPFGGVQLLLIGDLHQLPPVVKDEERHLLEAHYQSPYFFSSHALRSTQFFTIELTHVYRQENKHFLSLLSDIRSGRPSAQAIRDINTRYIPGFKASENEHWIYLTSHNATALRINTERLNALQGKAQTYHATITGDFPPGVFPADEELQLKVGEQVMFIKNDTSADKAFYNGLLGVVVDVEAGKVIVRPQYGENLIEVTALTWENRQYKLNEETGEIEEKVVGEYTQIPLRAAWAITIHKSQGLTFDQAIVDVSSCFAHGQAYVALSRLRTLEGLVLSAPITAKSVISDYNISEFMQSTSGSHINEEVLMQSERYFIRSILDSIYDFRSDKRTLDELHVVVADSFTSLYPSLVKDYANELSDFMNTVSTPATTFMSQYANILFTPDYLPLLTERLAASAKYFVPKLKYFVNYFSGLPDNIDNSALKKKFKEKRATLIESLSLKISLLTYLKEEPFSINGFQQCKRKALLSLERKTDIQDKEKKTRATALPTEVKDPALFHSLVAWRKGEANSQGIPAYRVVTTKSLIQIANQRPTTIQALLGIKGVGKVIAKLYGEQILAIVNGY